MISCKFHDQSMTELEAGALSFDFLVVILKVESCDSFFFILRGKFWTHSLSAIPQARDLNWCSLELESTYVSFFCLSHVCH